MNDVFANKVKGTFGWSVEDGNPIPPVHTFPKTVKERVDYFIDMMEDGLTFLGCLTFVFSDEKPEDYDFGATKDWLPKSEEFKEWEQLGWNLSQSEIAMYILFPLWEETDEHTRNTK